jgi:hypothetical protein
MQDNGDWFWLWDKKNVDMVMTAGKYQKNTYSNHELFPPVLYNSTYQFTVPNDLYTFNVAQ